MPKNQIVVYLKSVLANRTPIFILGVVLAIITGGLIIVMPKSYNVETVIQIGLVVDGQGISPVETPQQLVYKIINDVYGVKIREKLSLSSADFPKIVVEFPKDTVLVRSLIRTTKPEMASLILGELNGLILRDHNLIISIQKDALEADAKVIKDRLGLIEPSPANLYNAAWQLAMLNLAADLGVGEGRQKSLASLFRMTTVVKEPTAYQPEAWKNFLKNFLVMFLLGLVLGIIWFILKEWWRQNQ